MPEQELEKEKDLEQKDESADVSRETSNEETPTTPEATPEVVEEVKPDYQNEIATLQAELQAKASALNAYQQKQVFECFKAMGGNEAAFKDFMATNGEIIALPEEAQKIALETIKAQKPYFFNSPAIKASEQLGALDEVELTQDEKETKEYDEVAKSNPFNREK